MKIFKVNFVRQCLVLLAMLTTSTLKSEIKRGELGEKVYYEWETRTEEVRIWGEGPMTEAFGSSSPFFGKYIKTVVIGEGVTSIGGWAFYGCSSLTSVEIPETVTSIGWNTFSGCSSLISIKIPETVTSIGWGTFSGCSSLISIKIPEGVTSIGLSTFSGCSSLISIKIPEGVTSIGSSAFSGCSSLTSINIPEGVTSIGDYAFSGCSSLTSFVVDSKNSIYDSRENCNALIETATNTIIKGCNTSFIPASVTNIGESAFSGCTGLSSIEIPASVTSIGYYAFEGCTGLSSIVVNSNNKVYDSRENCNAIIETATNRIIIGCKTSVIPTSVTNIEFNVLSFDSTATEIEIPEGVTSIGISGFANFKSLTSIKIPSSITYIGSGAFRDCTSLTSIEIPSSVTSIGNYAFSGCTSLASIEIPSSVTSIGDCAFENCSSLTSIEIPEGISNIWSMTFQGCTSLASVKIPEGVYAIGISAFCNCKALTSIEIPSSVYTIGESAFYGCSSLASIEIPEGVKTIYRSAFGGCSSLTSIKIPASVEEIYGNPFAGCSALQSIVVDDKNKKYESRENCNAIIDKNYHYLDYTLLIHTCSSSVIPESVISIGEQAFSSQTSSVRIPETIEGLASLAFANCPYLSTIIFLGVTPPGIYENTFSEGTKKLGRFYVPKGSRGAYIDSGWNYSNGFDEYNILEYSDISEIPMSDDSSSPAENPAKYDLNGDYRVSTADVTKLVDYIMKHPELK